MSSLTDSGPSSPASPLTPEHPFAHARGQLEIIPNKIDVEEESRLYDDLCDEAYDPRRQHQQRPASPPRQPSIFSGTSITLDSNVGHSLAFARDVKIAGWTSVGDKRGGAYVVYDCVIKTREGTSIHALRRYSDFAQLEDSLHCTLPRHLRHALPPLPPKNPLARYRPVFLDRRRQSLQFWLSSVLLHPDIGACQAVREWVMN